MRLDTNTNILIVGLGVIGGSYAKALTDKGYKVYAITKDEETVEYAERNNMISYGTTRIEKELIEKANLIIFALYPTVFVDWIKEYGHMIKSGTLVTDVSGVKCSIVEKIQELLPSGVEFISAHPMAGRESSGVEFSDPKVFVGANYIVTPTDKNTKEAIETCKELGRVLGFARISELTCKEHDKMIAHLSQLTHCIAVCLMTANNTPELEKYTGDSFRDLTRIAKINDAMWSELFLMNRDMLLTEMDSFIEEFRNFRDMLVRGDREGMREKMRLSTKKRCNFDKPKGDIK